MKMTRVITTLVLSTAILVTSVLAPVSVYAMEPTSGSGFTSDMGEAEWCQRMFKTEGLRKGGCRVVAFSKMLSEAGFPVGDPQQYWDWCNTNNVPGKFNSGGGEANYFGDSLDPYAKSFGGSVELVEKVSVSGIGKAKMNSLIMDYIGKGYYCVLACGAHTVYVSRADSIAAGEAVLHESSFSTNYPNDWTGTYSNIVKLQFDKYNSGKYTSLRAYKISSPVTEDCGVEPGQYYIVSAVNRKYVLDVYGSGCSSGDNVNLWERNYSNAQRWNIKNAGNGCVYLEPQCALGYCLDVAGAGTTNKTNVQIWESNNTDAQKWKFVDAGDGTYCIIPQVGDGSMALDLKGAKGVSGTNIQIYQQNGTAAQKWILRKADACFFD